MWHNELIKKCMYFLFISGLLVLSSSFLYKAYVYSYEQIIESTVSCPPSNKVSQSIKQ